MLFTVCIVTFTRRNHGRHNEASFGGIWFSWFGFPGDRTSEKRVKKERTEMRTEHREEREKWAEQDQAKHVEMISSMQKNTEVLSGLKTLIGTIVK